MRVFVNSKLEILGIQIGGRGRLGEGDWEREKEQKRKKNILIKQKNVLF